HDHGDTVLPHAECASLLVLNRLQGLMHTVYLGLINVFVFLDRQLKEFVQQTTSPLVKGSVL
ncbi:hypothetical protein BYT27DRAFT_7184097, partial [Phlegmacium glaucopus]